MTHPLLPPALLDARLPRYTSYPPADRFTDRIGPEAMQDWLADVAPGTPVSLYVHVPFCRRLCRFCACRTQGTQSDAPLDRYLDHLDQEIALVAAALPPGLPVGALHLGGGTPTILSADRIDRLGEMIGRRFDIRAETEVSVEIDPTECDDDRLDALARLGTRRVSLGVQDFDPLVQETIGRQQSAALTCTVAEAARARGIDSLNVDLVYGLPHQDLARLEATLATVLELRPDRIALFGYAHVPWMSRRQALIPEETLPDGRARQALAARAREVLEGEGYGPVGIDHVALPGDSMARSAEAGTIRRNFQGYTTDTAPVLIGLGPSSISRFPQGYAQNQPATGAWQAAIAAGRPATVRGTALSRTDRQIADIVEALMCVGRVDLGPISRGTPGTRAALLRRAEALVADLPGIARLDGTELSVSHRAAWRLAASRFDVGLAPRDGRYSLAS